jgi:hypothetical protein
VLQGHCLNVCNVYRRLKHWLVHKIIAKPLHGCYGCSVRIIILEWLSGRSDQKAIPESGNPRRRPECLGRSADPKFLGPAPQFVVRFIEAEDGRPKYPEELKGEGGGT